MMEAGSIPKTVLETLKFNGITWNNSDNLISFCGVIIDKENTYVFLPREVDNNNLSKVDTYKYSSLLMRCIEMYSKESYNSIQSEEQGQLENSRSSLGVIRLILENYLHNGLYKQKRNKLSKDNGKTCWSATISKSFSTLNKRRQPIYAELYGKQTHYSNYNEVAQIQAEIVREVDARFSWFITGREGLIAPELRDVEKLNKSTEWKLARLKNEKRNTFSQAELNMISTLISYLENTYFQNSFVCGLTKFHFTWEHMMKKVLPNQFDLNPQLPIPLYVKDTGELLENNKKGMKTDISLHHPDKNKVIIVDAKYYAASKGNLPGWHDLVKQFYYVKSARLIFSTDYEFSNIFVFPGKIAANIKSAVVQDPTSKKIFNSEFPAIQCFYQCPLELMESYVTNNELHSLYTALLNAKTT